MCLRCRQAASESGWRGYDGAEAVLIPSEKEGEAT